MLAAMPVVCCGNSLFPMGMRGLVRARKRVGWDSADAPYKFET